MNDPLHPNLEATRLYELPTIPPAGFTAPTLPPGERFAPGTLLLGRYRLVAALGKGGMGEVYRADDLALGQPVALKFLPPHFADRPDRLQGFRKEVAVARKVSHPNCCRVYDLGEVPQGPGVAPLAFLSMEYIDGESLDALLKRVGRLPEEKAVEAARQLCLALAAVHEQDVLHRDLKPANVMLDGRGKVRLTDFGLAVATRELSEVDVCAGTPLYMAPEQLDGRPISERTDLFALGLVLYELFTGKMAFVGTDRDTQPSRPSGHVSGLDPAVERVILRCLERDPADRPASATEVLAGLPGGDPLAAAVAAGETPSPRLVADAGEVGLVKPWVGLALFVAVVVELLALARLYDTAVFGRMPLPKPPEVLADRAQDILRRLGCTDAPADTAQGFRTDVLAAQYAYRADPAFAAGEPLRVGGPAPVYFFYRQGPAALTPLFNGFGDTLLVTDDNPPPTAPGMAGVTLDSAGRLLGFSMIPAVAAARPAEWGPWFHEAGLDMAQFQPNPTGPVGPLPVACTERFAWEEPGGCRVEAGADQGRAAYFRVTGAWRRPERGEARSRLGSWLVWVTYAAAALLAVWNLLQSRGDMRTIARMGAVILALTLAARAVAGWHVPNLNYFAPPVLGLAAWRWVLAGGMYLALEPALRRRWPWRLTGWVRLFAGRLRDPLVGRDILIGLAAGLLMEIAYNGLATVVVALGAPGSAPVYNSGLTTGVTYGVTAPAAIRLLTVTYAGFVLPFLFLGIAFILFKLVRREAVAWGLFLLLLVGVRMYSDWRGSWAGNMELVALNVVWFGLAAVLLSRFGLLAGAAFTAAWAVLNVAPLTTHTTAWYFGSGAVVAAVVVGVAGYCCYTAIGGRQVLREGFFGAG